MERQIAYIALFAALIGALGLLPYFNLPFGVPISAQSLGVMLAGAVLGARRGALAVLLFLAIVALGVPLLAGGRGGLGVFVSYTAGFLVGFPIAAFVTGMIVEKWREANLMLVGTTGAIIGGILVLYAFGIAGMAIVMKKSLLEAAVLVGPFLPGDLIKAFLTGAVTQAIAKARPGAVLSRPV